MPPAEPPYVVDETVEVFASIHEINSLLPASAAAASGEQEVFDLPLADQRLELAEREDLIGAGEAAERHDGLAGDDDVRRGSLRTDGGEEVLGRTLVGFEVL